MLITGASSGIGEATARVFSAQGARLMLAGRRKENLERLAAELKCEYFVADVTQIADVHALVGRTVQKFGRIDVLINNAGIGFLGNFQDQTWQQIQSTLATNVGGVLAVTHAALPFMLKEKSGMIVNVSSVLGKRAMGGFAAYCASKFALQGFCDSLRKEVAGEGIQVCHFCPRLTKTEFHEKAGIKFSLSGADSAEKVARALLRAVVQRKPEHIMSWTERVYIKFKTIFG